MFEVFTERARRVIFFARYHASQDGDAHIHCIHLLAGIEHEAPELLREAGLDEESIKRLCASEELFHRGRKRVATSVEIPLDAPARRAIVLAAEAATRLKSQSVGPAHVFWGVFCADRSLRKKLSALNLTEGKLTTLCQKQSEIEGKTASPEALWVLAHPVRSGIGYDLHRLEPGRKLILGGIEVPFDRGPVGHSDGDVLSHAICDALLGGAGLGDIGAHFPDNDPQWKGASSLLFLERIRTMLEEKGLCIAHIDAVVIAERPRLGPHFPAMRDALAKALGIEPHQINLKAKTNEGVDALGRGEAIVAQAIATLEG
jgi:2-C-methyl-D-erythritol 2,4-cyclodiphosphate synthase